MKILFSDQYYPDEYNCGIFMNAAEIPTIPSKQILMAFKKKLDFKYRKSTLKKA